MTLTSCIDENYDLTKDIDMTMSVGGDYIAVPVGSTEEITLSMLLDLSDNSSIREAQDSEFGLVDGDYYFYLSELNEGTAHLDGITLNGQTITLLDQIVEIDLNCYISGGGTCDGDNKALKIIPTTQRNKAFTDLYGLVDGAGLSDEELATLLGESTSTETTETTYDLSMDDIEALVNAGIVDESVLEDPDALAESLSQGTFSLSGSLGTLVYELDYAGACELESDSVTFMVQGMDWMMVEAEVDIIFETDDPLTLQKGFIITFPEFALIEWIDGVENADKIDVVDNYIVVTAEDGLKLPNVLHVMLKKIDLAAVIEEGRAYFEPGDYELEENGKFEFIGTTKFIGNVEYDASDLTITTLNQSLNITLHTTVTIGQVTVNQVLGAVTQQLNLDTKELTSIDVPDILRNSETVIDLANPQLYFTIDNETMLRENVRNMTFTSYIDGEVVSTLSIGTGQETTLGDSLIIGNGIGYTMCISAAGAEREVENDVWVPTLCSIVSRLPDQIEISDIQAYVIPERTFVDLDSDLDVGMLYEFLVPVRFGENMNLVYETSFDGWNEKMPEISGVNKVQLVLNCINTMPLQIEFDATPIDSDGNALTAFNVSVDGALKAGSQTDPSSSEITLTVTAEDGSLSNLDGVKLKTIASDGDKAGVTMNKNQSLKFDKITLRILDGISITLNLNGDEE